MQRAMRWLAALVVALAVLPAAPTPAQAQTSCAFVSGFLTLRNLINAAEGRDVVGACVENERFAGNGDAQQRTSGGLLVWRKLDNWTAFTDGYWTWLNGPFGLQKRLNSERFSWEGGAAVPPPVSIQWLVPVARADQPVGP